jgi:deferrochelatase/peroxidase EfeB
MTLRLRPTRSYTTLRDVTGLFFICFQPDPRKQFIPIQTRLAEHDHLTEYTFHTGSAIFAVPPGVSEGEYIGQTLLEAI